jgi:hypothetical protein
MKKLLMIAVVLATWTARWEVATTCPNNEPTTNPYNGDIVYPAITHSLYCTKTRSRKMSKEFTSVQKARDFFKDCETSGIRCEEQMIEEIHE